MHRISVAAILSVVGLGAFAAPAAVAQAPFVGPNCQAWVISDDVRGVGAKEAAASVGLSIQEALDLIAIGCADAQENSVPARCEVGQSSAAEQALVRGDMEMYLFHLGALQNCFLGGPAGPPL